MENAVQFIQGIKEFFWNAVPNAEKHMSRELQRADASRAVLALQCPPDAERAASPISRDKKR